MKQKSFFVIFKGLSIEVNRIFLEGESSDFKLLFYHSRWYVEHYLFISDLLIPQKVVYKSESLLFLKLCLSK